MWPRLKFPLLCLLFGAGVTGGHAAVAVGETFPSLGAAALEGGPPPATAGRVTLVDFWASWCDPCKASFPAYAQLQSDYRTSGLLIVAVSVDVDPDKFAAFVKRVAPPFPILRDATHQLVRQVQVPVMPTCYLLGRDGRVRFVHQGFHGAESEREIRREIDSLLAETAPSS
jgi:thiol-disulfide isomerase/thioredoxin